MAKYRNGLWADKLAIKKILAHTSEALQTLHDTTPDFMSRFIFYFDGEKDPRDLMVVFSILKVPMVEWDVSADAQVNITSESIWVFEMLIPTSFSSMPSSTTFLLRFDRHPVILSGSLHNS